MRRAYLLLLALNAAAVALAAVTAALLTPPRGWPAWVPVAWWAGAALLSGVVWFWRWLLGRRQGEEAENERRVAALSLASLPLLWSLFAVIAFWTGYPRHAAAFLAVGLGFAAVGYALQPGE